MLGNGAAVRPLSADQSYALSPMQAGMLFEALLHGATAGDAGWNVEQVHGVLSESIELGPFRAAWTLVARRHPVLSTAFRWEGLPAPQQEVRAEVKVPVEITDLSLLGAEEAAARFAQFLREDRERAFDLTRAPLMRVMLFVYPENRAEFVWTFHHILLDGRTFAPLLREVFTAYEALREGRTPDLPPPPRAYADFIGWLGARDTTRSLAYFKQLLAGKNTPTPLPSAESAQRPLPRHGYGEAISIVEPRVVEAARAIARTTDTTLGTVVQAAWALVVSRYTHDRDVLFGATRACRRSALDGNTDAMIGLFINTLPVRARVGSERTVAELLRDIRDQSMALREHEHTPLVDIQGQSDIPRGTPLFETLVMFETQELNKTLRAAGPAWEKRKFYVHEQPSIPLNVTVFDGDEFELRLLYDRRRFTEASVQRIAQTFATALEQLSAEATRPLGQVSVLSAAETERVLRGWNQTRYPFAEDRLIHEGFEQQVDTQPDAPALEMDGVSLTFREVEERANRLAHYLIERGAGSGKFVCVCLNRSPELVISILAITKAGAAYVPMDPAYPVERLSAMIRISEAITVVTQAEHRDKFTLAPVVIDGDDTQGIAAQSSARPPRRTTSRSPCYIIFTSGSTGEPKGCLLEHHAVQNTLEWITRTYEIKRGDRMLFVTSCCFDLSVYDMFGGLGAGATVVVASRPLLRDPEAMMRVLLEGGITVWNSAPAALQRLVPFFPPGFDPVTLRLVMLSGDWIPLTLPDVLKQAFPGVAVKSLGGATECAVWSNYFDIGPLDPRWTSIPYGRPMQNCSYHLLDDELRPVPVGAVGEMYIGGVCLAAGYRNRPDLTAERFIPDPFLPGERLYKTGDLGRYFDTGDLEFLGRADSQVKIRGFRIEMGEVELAISKLPGVNEVVCNAYTDGSGLRSLAAYIVPKEGATVEPTEIKRLLGQQLPDFMVPSQVLLLKALPLSSNGKVDRKALPSPLQGVQGAEYVAARTNAERTLVDIWQRVLKRTPIGVTESFFDLGGHSMLAVLLMSEIKGTLGLEVPLSRIIECPTIELLARSIGDELPTPEPDTNGTSTELQSLLNVLKKGGERALFLIHDGDGETLLYHGLAQKLPASLSVFGVQPRRLPNIPLAHLSVNEMASHYIEELRRQQPSGPYYLGGLCAGGVIAFEMAAQLERSGERTELVVLLDAVEPTTPQKPFLETAQRLRNVRDLWLKKGNGASEAGGAPMNGVHAASTPGAPRPNPLVGTARKVRGYLEWVIASNSKALGVAARIRVLRRVLAQGTPWPEYVPPLRVRDIYEAARDAYAPEVAHIPHVLLVKASASVGGKGDIPVNELFSDPLLGWGKYVDGKIEVIEALGGHSSMLQEPYVASLARTLEAYLPGGRPATAPPTSSRTVRQQP